MVPARGCDRGLPDDDELLSDIRSCGRLWSMVHRLPELRKIRMLLGGREQSEKDPVNVEHHRLSPHRFIHDSPRGAHMRSEEQLARNNLSSIMEQRRFRVRDSIYVIFCSELCRLGRIVDISRKGLSFE